MQHKKWIPIRLMRCVHTHWGRFAIKGRGSPSCVLIVLEKIGEDNQKIGKISGNPLTKSFRWKQSRKRLKTILEGQLVNKFDMCWNVNLKQSNESSRS
jgi:hypothetical protein